MARVVKVNGEDDGVDHVDTGERIPVVFTDSISPYTKGEIAGFSEKVVTSLERRNHARRLKDSEITKSRKAKMERAQIDAEKGMANVPNAMMTAGGQQITK
jgi:hypothetical protein